MKKRVYAAALAMTMTVPMLVTGCGAGSGSAGADTSFTWWIYNGQDSSYYTEYAENPAIQYTLTKTWGTENKKIGLEFWVPTAGQEQNNYSTMIASGDLPDIIDSVICDPAPIMYEKGYALDLADYDLPEVMPNYYALITGNETWYKNAVMVDAEGKEHFYSLLGLLDEPNDLFQGFMYRRDWIVKYGTNPETGEAFTGGYTDLEDPDSWVDDVVFPCGETDPVYVSDWEWMFEIFETAMEAEGIEDGYCISLFYPGFTWSGGLLSCFGGGTNVWYQDENSVVQFGGDDEAFRTYLEAMNSWYEKGWLDQAFNERTSDAFYQIDSTTVRQGKVGMWDGMQAELGGRIDMHDGGYTEGIYAAGCAYPINDVYGPEECQNVIPNCVMGNGTCGGGVIITPTAADKDVRALLSYLDYFYSEEGALIKTLGLGAEQAAQSGSSFYTDYNMEDGAYSIGDDGRYVRCETLINDSGNLGAACAFQKAPGLTINGKIDRGYAESYEASLKAWTKYPNTGFFQGSITTGMMSAEDSKTCDDLRAKVLEYMTNNAVDFITGKKDISSDSSDWAAWCKTLGKYNVDKISDIYQGYVDRYPFY